MRWTILALFMVASAGGAYPGGSVSPVIVEWSPAESPGGRLSGSSAKAETTLLADSFEQTWPAPPWRVTHGSGAAEVDWGRTNHRASDGSHSIWCAGSGSQSPGQGGQVPTGTESWAIAGPFDLTEATAGRLTFDLWLETEEFQDLFMWLASTDGQSFRGIGMSSDTGGWTSISADLSSWGAAGDVTGHERVWIAFVYRSDHSNRFEGAYVDKVVLISDSGGSADQGFTYSRNEDFELGAVVGLNIASDALQLSDGWTTLPYLWVPSSGSGTVSRVDTLTGAELARYRTGPDRDLDPSAATVDLRGACWVGNRGAGTVVKIGLVENGGCVDRDGNGTVDTSTDVDGDGSISADELLDWGADECVLHEVVVVAGQEATFTPGEVHESYSRNHIRALAVDASNDVWVGVYDSATVYRVAADSGEILDSETVDVSSTGTHPHALVVDRGGMLWSASWPDQWVLKVDTTTGELAVVDLIHGSWGLALDEDEHLFVTGFSDRALSRIDVGNDEVDWPGAADWQASGVAVTADGDVWVAAAGAGTVTRYSVDGSVRAVIPIVNGPTGLAVDSAGKVWVVGSATDAIVRIDPVTNRADLETQLVGAGGRDAASDMTGIVARTITSRFGTWTVVYDSALADTAWGTISWIASEPEGTAVLVRVRSSPDQVSWSPWETAGNGQALSATAVGQYLQIEVAVQLRAGDTSPVLEELTVMPAGAVPAPEASFTWAPPEPDEGQPVRFTDTSTGEPTGWAWDFGDGGASSEQSPLHTFETPGTFVVTLTASNDGGTNSVSNQIVVRAQTNCEIVCTAAVPATAALAEEVDFVASATPTDCSEEVSFSWAFGDGATSTDAVSTHTYETSGTYRWMMAATASGVTCARSAHVTISGAGPEDCTSVYWVPVVSHADGAMGSLWRSDLGLLGSGERTAAVELRLHGAEGTLTRVVSVAAGAMVDLVDVVDWISPGAEVSAALELCSDGTLTITSRTYNQLGGDDACRPNGSFGQYLEGVEASAGLVTGEAATLPHLRENASFRSNLGWVNTGTETATVRVTLADGTGATVAEYTVNLEPGSWWQDNRPFAARAGLDELDAGSARVEVVAGRVVVAYASVIDNTTNDAVTIPMRR